MRRSRNTYEDQDDRSALLATILNKHACAFSTAMKHRSVQRQRGGLASRLSRTPDHLEEPDELLVLQLEGHRPDPRVHLAHLHTARPPQSTRRPPQTTRPSGPSRTSAHGATVTNEAGARPTERGRGERGPTRRSPSTCGSPRTTTGCWSGSRRGSATGTAGRGAPPSAGRQCTRSRRRTRP